MAAPLWNTPAPALPSIKVLTLIANKKLGASACALWIFIPSLRFLTILARTCTLTFTCLWIVSIHDIFLAFKTSLLILNNVVLDISTSARALQHNLDSIFATACVKIESIRPPSIPTPYCADIVSKFINQVNCEFASSPDKNGNLAFWTRIIKTRS